MRGEGKYAAAFLIWSGRRELNPGYKTPSLAYCRYTTPRFPSYRTCAGGAFPEGVAAAVCAPARVITLTHDVHSQRRRPFTVRR